MRLFDFLQFAEQLVICRIAQRGLIEYVVLVAGARQPFAQFSGALRRRGGTGGGFRRHGTRVDEVDAESTTVRRNRTFSLTLRHVGHGNCAMVYL